jgi:hypothetical protein
MSLFTGIATGTGSSISRGISSYQGITSNITRESQKGFDKTGNIFGRMENRGGVVGVRGKIGGIQNDIAASSAKVITGIWEMSAGLLSSAWGGSSTTMWDNSGSIAGSRATESKQYQTMNRSVADVKASMGIQQLSQADSWLKNKANEQNTITQTIKEDTSSWFGASHDVDYSYRYWQESNDQLLGRYGYETYAQKATNLTESLKWMEVKDMDKLNSDVLLADVKDTAGQDVERQVAGNQMNNYFGQYYVDATKV